MPSYFSYGETYLDKNKWDKMSDEEKGYTLQRINDTFAKEDGDLVINGPKMDEVVITPSEEDKRAVRNAKAMWRDKKLRFKIYDDLKNYNEGMMYWDRTPASETE